MVQRADIAPLAGLVSALLRHCQRRLVRGIWDFLGGGGEHGVHRAALGRGHEFGELGLGAAAVQGVFPRADLEGVARLQGEALDGVGERYDGSWYVDAVAHRFGGAGYTQRFSLLRNARRRRDGILLAGDAGLGAFV